VRDTCRKAARCATSRKPPGARPALPWRWKLQTNGIPAACDRPWVSCRGSRLPGSPSVRKNPNELPVTDGSKRVFRRFLGVSIGNWGGFFRALSGEGSPLNAGQTLFSQLLDCLPWNRFARIVTRHGGDRWVQTFPGSEQDRAMAFAQLTFRESLRDIEACLSAQPGKRGVISHWEASHGFKSGTPVVAKSATFRVTTVKPCVRAVAAMNASRSGRGSGT